MEEVTLLDHAGTPIGTMSKELVHTHDTALHLAFSCHVLDDRGRVLVTRRALVKRTWPGVWTNSFCGHPLPGEEMVDAIARRAADELGVRVHDVRLALPDYRYRAVDAGGIVENEVCPVHIARIDGEPLANPDEVAEWFWADVEDLLLAVSAVPAMFSPWMREQLPLLRAAGEL